MRRYLKAPSRPLDFGTADNPHNHLELPQYAQDDI
jgi:hypothetical protein